MDLGAYSNIEDLSKIAKENGIEVPRLRGYRLMRDEKPIDYRDTLKRVEVDCCIDMCQRFWNPDQNWCELSTKVDEECTKYIAHYDKRWEQYNENYTGPELKVRWNMLTEKQVKILSDEIIKCIKSHKKQYAVWNKYCGRDDVLYIHSRIGGWNWKSYDGPKLRKEPWFLAKVDDCEDSTYCDIYAKINPIGPKTEK